MAIGRDIGKRLRPALVPAVGLVLLGYFIFHAIQGDRGLVAWLVLKQEIRVAEAKDAVLAGEEGVLEQRVAALSPGSLDPDMIEERARIMLNYAHPDELVILLARPESGGVPNGQPASSSGVDLSLE
jgi:cell division protein FtsB